MEGQWSEHVPAENPAPARYQQCLICPKCNFRSCRFRKSTTDKNPNRWFYICPAPAVDHKFFKWADDVKPHELIQVPYCGGCAAGFCRVRRVKGRIMFMCRVMEGEGSCGYRVWQDELEMSEAGLADEKMNMSRPIMENCNKTTDTVTDMVKDSKYRDEGTDTVSSLLDPSDDLLYSEVIFEMDHEVYQEPHFLNEPETIARKMDQLKCLEDKSCGYRVCQDELEMSEAGLACEKMNMSQPIMENCNKTTDTVTDMVRDSKCRDEGTDTVSPLLDPSDDLLYSEVISEMDHEVIQEPTISRKMDQLKCLEDKSDIISMRPRKRSRYGDKASWGEYEARNGFLFVDFGRKDCLDSGFPTSVSFLTASMVLNSMSTSHSWMADAIRQNLSTELNGWWGRLAFHPMPCLMTCALKPSVSYPREPTFLLQDIWVNSSGSVIPARNSRGAESYRKLSFNLEQHHNPIDSSFVVQDKILVNSSDAATLVRHRVIGAESYSKPFVTKGQRHSIMSNAFHQAAECLQNELLSRLEAMDAKDHETMSQAAEDTFSALDCLFFDHQDFKKRAKKLIHCASSLVEIEQSMPTNDSYQKLVELCSSERVRLDEISCVHAEAVEAVVNNMKSLKVMQEEISSTMDWLFQIKAKVCCYEVKMSNLELELEEIAKNKEVLERKYLIASKELEESQKLLEQKEAEHNAAKAAFERARALLRG